MDITQIKNKILSFADEGEKWIKSLSQEVYNNPEGGFTEEKCSALVRKAEYASLILSEWLNGFCAPLVDSLMNCSNFCIIL